MTGEDPEPVCRRNPGLLYGLANLIDNAVDFAVETVVIEAAWTAHRGQDRDPRRRAGLCPGGAAAGRRALCDDPRGRRARPRGGAARASVSACSSPRPCIERSGAQLLLTNALRRGPAPSCGSFGRAPRLREIRPAPPPSGGPRHPDARAERSYITPRRRQVLEGASCGAIEISRWPRCATVAFEARGDNSLLIVDDDRPFSSAARPGHGSARLSWSASPKAWRTASRPIESQAPAFAVIDMRLGDGNGLDVIARLKERRPEARGVILTGYGNIATAVTAVKLGAFDYLAKPADADEIYAALIGAARRARRSARKPDVGRPGALGAHPAGLRAVRPQRLRDRAPAQHASAHACSASSPSARRARLVQPLIAWRSARKTHDRDRDLHDAGHDVLPKAASAFRHDGLAR